MGNSKNFWIFIFGLLSMTHVNVFGSIGISEFVPYATAPLLLLLNYGKLRRDGFLPVVWLSFLVMVGCCIASSHNATPMMLFLKGFAQVYSLFAYIVFYHHVFRKNLNGVKWLLLGICFSNIINVFVFRQGFEVGLFAHGVEDDVTTEMIVSGPLFWLNRVGGFLLIPIQGWYGQTPIGYSVVAVLVMAVFTMVTTDSGRSAMVIAAGSAVMIALGRKSAMRMGSIGRHFGKLCIIGLVVVFALKTGYAYLAGNGYLNEKAQKKYEKQMKQGTGVMRMLSGGRAETFAGLLACFDNPIWGFGPWSLDEKGYMLDFVLRFGDEDDFSEMLKRRNSALAHGWVSPMPCHSHVVGFWVRYGILGLPFWFYVFYLMFRYIRHDITAIPQWYGMMSVWICGNLWHILFSPYSGRVTETLTIACLLFCNAVRRGTIMLPPDMEQERMRFFNIHG